MNSTPKDFDLSVEVESNGSSLCAWARQAQPSPLPSHYKGFLIKKVKHSDWSVCKEGSARFMVQARIPNVDWRKTEGGRPAESDAGLE